MSMHGQGNKEHKCLGNYSVNLLVPVFGDLISFVSDHGHDRKWIFCGTDCFPWPIYMSAVNVWAACGFFLGRRRYWFPPVKTNANWDHNDRARSLSGVEADSAPPIQLRVMSKNCDTKIVMWVMAHEGSDRGQDVVKPHFCHCVSCLGIRPSQRLATCYVLSELIEALVVEALVVHPKKLKRDFCNVLLMLIGLQVLVMTLSIKAPAKAGPYLRKQLRPKM